MSISWWVDIENASGTRQGPGPLLPTRWRSTAVLNRAGSFEFEIPATDTRAATLLQPKRIARCKAVINGATVEVGAGIIETITIRISNGVPMRVVSGPDLLGELRRYAVDKRLLAPLLAYYYLPTFVNDDEVPYKLLADYANKASAGWSVADKTGVTYGSGATITASNIYARFRDDSVLNALIRVAEITGEHFRIGTGRQVQWLGRDSDFVSSNVRAVMGGDGNAIVDGGYTHLAQIASISHVEDAQGMVNRVIIYGNGEGDNRLTIRGATVWPDGVSIITTSPHFRTMPNGRNYYLVAGNSAPTVNNVLNCLEDATSTAAYGVHEQALQISNIAPLSNTTADIQNAANQLVRAAWEYILQNAEPRNSYSLRLVGCNTVLRPGTTIPVHAQRWVDGQRPIDINETLNILGATIELDADGLRTSDLMVSDGVRQPMSAGDVIAAQAAKSYVMQAHPQMGPSIDTISFKEDFDDTISAEMPFWFGDETAQIQQILFRFKIDALRSTVESVASSSTTSSSGGGATVTSASGGGATPTSSSYGGNHGHSVPVNNGTTGNPVYYNGTTGRFEASGGSNVISNNTDLTHTHTVTIAAHTHDVTIATHTHTVAPTITTTYGIFQDSGGTVADVSTITLRINGILISAGAIVPLSSNWHQVDLTVSLLNSTTLRPNNASNSITCIGSVGKRGRITAQLQIRSTIQSIAYSI